jgi:hypothetical protein
MPLTLRSSQQRMGSLHEGEDVCASVWGLEGTQDTLYMCVHLCAGQWVHVGGVCVCDACTLM